MLDKTAAKSESSPTQPEPHVEAQSPSLRSTLEASARAAVLRMIETGGEVKREAQAVVNALAHGVGHDLGVGLGVIVTEGLAALPSWNAPVLDGQGHPVESVPGASRVGNHDIRKRHEEVVGPKINAVVSRVPDGVLRQLVAGLGAGASEAPGDSYRLEAAIEDLIARHLSKK